MSKKKKHEAVIGLYGNVTLERSFCPECQHMAFIRSGEMACCGYKTEDVPTKYERMIEPRFVRRLPALKVRQAILEEQEHACFYCRVMFGAWGIREGERLLIRLNWDHQLPFSLTQNNQPRNVVAACHVCNNLKGSRVFQDVDEICVFLADRRKEKGYNW